jgi:hypothetical protein
MQRQRDSAPNAADKSQPKQCTANTAVGNPEDPQTGLILTFSQRFLEKLFSSFLKACSLPASMQTGNFFGSVSFDIKLGFCRRSGMRSLKLNWGGQDPWKQLRTLAHTMRERNKLLQMREYCCYQIYVAIDLDKVAIGFTEIRIWPPK